MSDVGLLDKDLSDADLDMLEKDIVPYQLTFCWSPRRLEDDFKTYLEDAFNVTISCLPRRLEEILKTYSQDILNSSWINLEDVLEDEKLLRWRRLQYVLEMSSRSLADQQMFAKS